MSKNKKNEVQNPVWVPVAKLHKNSKSLDVIWVVYDHQVKRLPSIGNRWQVSFNFPN